MNLSTRYLGLDLRTPLVAGASPFSERNESLQEMEEAGISAIVFHSLFEEQIRRDMRTQEHPFAHGGNVCREALSYFPGPNEFAVWPTRYLRNLRRAKETLQIPVIGSLNGATFGGWTTYARSLEQAGADALELNLYSIPTDPGLTAQEVEAGYLTILASVKAQVQIPVSVKLSPYFSNLMHFAKRLVDEGADGLVLFNRFYQPDIDLESFEVAPSIHLSTSNDLRLPMRWVALLSGRIPASLAASSGIHSGTDALKLVLAGADVTMLCSALISRGIAQIRVIETEMCNWLDAHGYNTLAPLRGLLSQRNCPDPSAFERAQYMRAIAIERAYEPKT
jgi:dihydroorotate dehydrogenase (fumarate)